ncbi:MAG: SMP-30/gluconolactonase/LRE family protein, partial [Ignavibacteriales bacterium]|nr:SMP-30/gluconolactonase/LRE family protein [Ignavibacteriales bacterium]
MDSKGNVYYTDLKHVWKISPDVTKSIAVRNVHTHELHIDREDNLYGEHLWYEGEATDKWGHRVWRLRADGKLTDIIPARGGFREDYNDVCFVRDRQGSQYWIDRTEKAVRMQSSDGMIRTLAVSNFRNVRWMTVTPGGIVFLVDLHDLVRVGRDGSVRTIARNLATNRRAFLFFTNEHAVMGLTADENENVYVAVSADQTVRKITPDGRRIDVAKSKGPWAPTGVCIGPRGDLFILEYAGTSVRVMKVDGDGNVTRY